MKHLLLFSLALLLLGTGCNSGKTAQEENSATPPKVQLTKDQDMELQQELLAFMKLLEFTREHYVDENAVSYKKLFQGAMDGMLEHLDPYSRYQTPQNFSLSMDDTRGSFAGIGATIQKVDDGIKLTKIQKGSPAEKAGLKAGDILLSIDKTSLKDLSLEDSIGKIRGKKGSAAILKVRRKNQPDKEYTVIRDIIKTPSITHMGIIQKKIGYFRINQFTATTADELDEYLKEYGKKIDRLIIDLRFNPGGQLDVTVETLSRFLEKGLLVVSVEGRSEGVQRHEAISCKKYTHIPIVVLINEFSASASEIFAGCMKDYKRAVVIGEKSFGKGSVQRIYPMPDGGGARITIAKYYTPSRKVIHGKGIEPDVVVKLPEDDKKAMAEYLMEHDEEPLPVKTDSYTDKQLEKAIQIVLGLKEFHMIK